MDPYDYDIERIESELDAYWPLWDSVRPRGSHVPTRGKPFNSQPLAQVEAIKWLLKRRLQVQRGDLKAGVMIRPVSPTTCIAHSLPAHCDGRPNRPAPPALLLED